MKGILLAGGTGSRLRPLTEVTNKHLLPVGNKPMIMHGISKFVESDIKDIMIVTDSSHMTSLASFLGSGKRFNCDITYKVQDEPNGIGGALKLCEAFVGKEDFIVILGDNMFQEPLSKTIDKFREIKEETPDLPVCVLNLIKVKDPQRFGIATIKDDKIEKIVEKPSSPDSDLCVTGIYAYDKSVFKTIDRTKISARGEYEISDVNNMYVKEERAFYNLLSGWWIDAGTFSSYHKANQLLKG